MIGPTSPTFESLDSARLPILLDLTWLAGVIPASRRGPPYSRSWDRLCAQDYAEFAIVR